MAYHHKFIYEVKITREVMMGFYFLREDEKNVFYIVWCVTVLMEDASLQEKEKELSK